MLDFCEPFAQVMAFGWFGRVVAQYSTLGESLATSGTSRTCTSKSRACCPGSSEGFRDSSDSRLFSFIKGICRFFTVLLMLAAWPDGPLSELELDLRDSSSLSYRGRLERPPELLVPERRLELLESVGWLYVISSTYLESSRTVCLLRELVRLSGSSAGE